MHPLRLSFVALTLAAATFAPAASAPLSVAQLKLGLYLHWDVATFAGYDVKSPQFGRQPATAFAPKAVPAADWVRLAKEAGMDFAVLTAKHESGFCLWPAKDMDYSVANSPGKPDVMAAFVAACKAGGIVPGAHYSLVDAHLEGRVMKGALPPAVLATHRQRLVELHTRYPELRVQILDGSTRLSPPQFEELCAAIKQANPACVVLDEKIEPRHVVTTVNSTWMWTPDQKIAAGSRMVQLGELAVSAKRPFLLNVGIDRTGAIPENCVAVVKAVGTKLGSL